MTNSEKQLLTMAINDAHAALEYAEKCGSLADIEKAHDRYSAARKAYRKAKKAKPRKVAHQDEVPAVEINL
jgi:ABC-type transporter lipoprotein component MlaA